MLKKLLWICAGIVVAVSMALTTLLNWPLPEMPHPGTSGDFLVRNVSIVDVAHGRVIPGQDVVVLDGSIRSVSASGSLQAVSDMFEIDGSEQYLLPGLWDMHVHSLKLSPQYNHPLFIANGVTSVREMWGCTSLPDSFVACGEDIEQWRKAVSDRAHLAPRYIQRSSFAINGEQGVPQAAPVFFRARDASEARQLVVHHADSDVDLLKTYTNLSVPAYIALAAV